MGAWIEILSICVLTLCIARRTPRWVRGLKLHYHLAVVKGLSRTPRWVRGLKSKAVDSLTNRLRRTPRWVRGLKYNMELVAMLMSMMSHPTMGAWIEIVTDTLSSDIMICRTPRWVRGLKYLL